MTRHVAPEVQDRLDEIDIADLRTLALRYLGTGKYTCIDPDRRIYVGHDDKLYRSPYIAPDDAPGSSNGECAVGWSP